MLARYKLYRGKRPADDPLPDGKRFDTRKHTRHCVRPSPEIVQRFLADPGEAEWKRFRKSYLDLLEQRFREDRAAFDQLAAQARAGDVYLGCSCPSKANPRLERCHTVLALKFLARKYRDLEVVFP